MSIEIEDIRVSLDPDVHEPCVRAYISFVVAGLCVRRIRVIELPSGVLGLIFPDRQTWIRCDATECRRFTPPRSRYCVACGAPQPNLEASAPQGILPRRHESIVFPTSAPIRAQYEEILFSAYRAARDLRDRARRSCVA